MAALLMLAFGAVGGAIARWSIGVWLNPLLGTFALGTLLINWLGCFLIGLTMGLTISEQTKLWLVTGFLGSFTTFSTFSAEVGKNLIDGKWLPALIIFTLHTLGGFVCTLIAFYLVRK